MDPESFKALEKWAADEFRSLNGQIEFIVHQAMKKEGRQPKKPAKPSSNDKTDQSWKPIKQIGILR